MDLIVVDKIPFRPYRGPGLLKEICHIHANYLQQGTGSQGKQ